MERRGFDYYEARAQDVKLADITSCRFNAQILLWLRDQYPTLDHLDINTYEKINSDRTFDIEQVSDIGWLGYFIGKSKYLKTLWISSWGEGEKCIEAFIEGLNRNRSIVRLNFYTDLRDVQFRSLGPFFRNNNNLAELELNEFEVGLEIAQSIARTLIESQCQSLKIIEFGYCNLGDEGAAEIVTALRNYPQLEELNLESNNIGLMGCIALGDTMREWGTSNLKTLYLEFNAIDDEGLQALAAGLANIALEELYISGNNLTTGTGAGLGSLLAFLQSENCRLRTLVLHRTGFGDEGAVALADGLMGNKFLTYLSFANARITDVGWAAFSKLLCDPSSINSTYLSNHRIKMDVKNSAPPDLSQYLEFNEHPNPAIYKILKSHPDLDMEPFFRWKLKLLPVVIKWFENVRARMRANQELVQRFLWNFEGRELSAVYKFVRAMPALTAISYWQQFVANAQAKRSRIDDERRRLEIERSSLYYEEEAAWVRLGGRPGSEGSNSNTNLISGVKRMRQE